MANKRRKAMPSGDQAGQTFNYTHEEGLGFGQHHAGQELIAEMRELDMVDGQQVVLLAFDEDSHWPIIEWKDATGIERHTTIDPDFFDQHFTAVAT